MEGFRLSPQQRRLLDSLSGRESAFAGGHACLVDIQGPLDQARLDRSIQSVVDAEEILRTHYPVMAGARVQAVAPADSAGASELVDLTGLEADEQRRRIESFASAHRDPFPEAPGRALTATVFRLEPGRHALLLGVPAASGDAMGQVQLARRVARAYANGGSDVLADDERLQYADVAEWCNSILEDEDAGTQAAYWKAAVSDGLTDPEPVLRAERAGDASPSSVDRVSLTLDESTGEALEQLANTLSVERQTVILAAWAALLSRVGACTDFSIAWWSDGRSYDELRDCLGLLGKDLPLSVSVQQTLPFRSLVEALSRQTADLLSHQEHFDAQGVFGAAHAELGTSMLQTAFAFSSSAWREQAGEATFAVGDLVSHSGRFAVKLGVLDSADGLKADLWFDASVVDEAAARRLAGRFVPLLRAAVAEPDLPVCDLPVITAADEEAILVNIARDVPASAADVVERFCESAAGHAAKAAVSCGTAALSHAELDARSNRIARLLRERGAGPNVPVGVCMQRSPDVMAAILGVLKAGAAYVPLDADYPADRIEFILSDSGATTLVTDTETAGRLAGASADLLCLDTEDFSEADAFEPVKVDPEDLAYILYTSGSTGRPKGVAVTRANLAFSTAARRAYYGETPAAFLLLSSIAFDSSVAGIFWTLTEGGHLVFPGGESTIDSGEIAELIRRHGVSHVLCLPSVYNLMLDTIPADAMSSLSCVVVAGESCTAAVVGKHRELRPNSRLFNEYGPTECTVWSTVFRCDDGVLRDPVPIGCAIPGASVSVLDDSLRPVPAGTRGELYIAGPGLTRGYWNRPDLTRERFVDVDMPSIGRVRAYKSGDLGRLRPDGSIEFLGRRDFQVKINGYRIELEEVESAIGSSPGVRDAAVVIREAASGDSQLAGFVRLEGDASLDDVRAHLETVLPRYMVPAFMTVVADYPRMPNGKIDRSALAASFVEQESASYVAPTTDLEQLQADIWAELLGRERVGIEDDFFRLGGHSILATRLIAQLRELLQIPIPIRLIFDHPSIAAFTEALRSNPDTARELQLVESALAGDPAPTQRESAGTPA